MEYAVETLKVRNIIVLGHEHCFGAPANVDGAAQSDPNIESKIESKCESGALAPASWFVPIVQAAHRLEQRVFHDDAAYAEEARMDRDLIESLSTADALAGDDPEQLALLSVMQCLRNLRSDPDISQRESQGVLCLHGAYYNIETGRLLALHEGRKKFVPVATEVYAIALRATDR